MRFEAKERAGPGRRGCADKSVCATVGELAESLRVLEQRDQLRELATIPGVNFCSNDYLGLAEDARLKRAVLLAVEHSARVGGTGSRLLSGHDAVWNELEEEFAEFAGTEAALYFSSGYAANVGLLSAVLGKNDVVFSDQLNHASLIDGIRLSGARKEIYPHLDMNALEALLRAHSGGRGRRVVVTESVFSMDGDLADLRAIHSIAEKNDASVIVDDAHATGVFGPRGAGMAMRSGLAESVLAVVHTCGKALGSAGALVCGSKVLRDYLVNHARTLIFSTAMPPYMAGQIRAALRLAREMDREREMLLRNAQEFALGLRGAGWDTAGTASQIVPVVIGENDETVAAAEYAQQRGFAVRAIRPPTVAKGSARLRLSLTAKIAESELRRLRESLQSWRETRVAKTLPGSAVAPA